MSKSISDGDEASVQELDTILRYASPRPGGYVKVLSTQNSQDSASGDDDIFKYMCPDVCREEALCKKCHQAGTSGTKNKQNTGSEQDSELSIFDEEAKKPDNKPPINLVSVVISTVMLLASGHDVSIPQLKTVVAYLSCIKDDNGLTPPNMQGLLNFINLKYGVQENSVISPVDSRNVQIFTTGKQNKNNKKKS